MQRHYCTAETESVAFFRREIVFSQDATVEAFNIGINAGAAAGQTVMHVHVHVIPRRKNDCADPRGGIRWIFPDRAKYW